MKELLLKVVELPPAERYRLAFLIAESLGYTLKNNMNPIPVEIERLRTFVDWVDTWVSNPASAYSVDATEGLFGMARDRIAALSPPLAHGEAQTAMDDRDATDEQKVVR